MGVCGTCKGSGKQRIQFTDYTGRNVSTKPVEIDCIRCDGTGSDIGKVFLEDLVTWCKCDQQRPGYYWMRNEHRGCVSNGTEHIHCSNCQGIVQIG